MFVFQGQMTGVCEKATKTCEVLAWCPVENDHDIPEYVDTLNESNCRTCDYFICDDSVASTFWIT